MVTIRKGSRIARSAPLRLCCAAIIFDAQGRVLVTRRQDDGYWCFPGGAIDSGETVAEACVREVLEETGLEVRVTRLLGVYSSPDYLCEYPDGNRWHMVELRFEATAVGGVLRTTDEVTEVRYCDRGEIDRMQFHSIDRDRMDDVFAAHPHTVVR